MNPCRHCSEPPVPGSQFCTFHKCCKCLSGRQLQETGGRYQSRCAKCAKKHAINALNYRKRQRDRLQHQNQMQTTAAQQLIYAATWSGAPLIVNPYVLPIQNGDTWHPPCVPAPGTRDSGMLMLVPQPVGRPHQWGGHTRDGQRPQLEAAPKYGRTNPGIPYLNSRLLGSQDNSTRNDTTAFPNQHRGNGIQGHREVPRIPEVDYQQISMRGSVEPTHVCEVQPSKGSVWQSTSPNGHADALKNEPTIRRVLDTISALARGSHEINVELQLELLFSLALPDSPSLVNNLCKSDITIDDGQRDSARSKAFGSSYPCSIATDISTYLGSTTWDSDEDEMNRRRELYEAYVQNRKPGGRVAICENGVYHTPGNSKDEKHSHAKKVETLFWKVIVQGECAPKSVLMHVPLFGKSIRRHLPEDLRSSLIALEPTLEGDTIQTSIDNTLVHGGFCMTDIHVDEDIGVAQYMPLQKDPSPSLQPVIASLESSMAHATCESQRGRLRSIRDAIQDQRKYWLFWPRTSKNMSLARLSLHESRTSEGQTRLETICTALEGGVLVMQPRGVPILVDRFLPHAVITPSPSILYGLDIRGIARLFKQLEFFTLWMEMEDAATFAVNAIQMLKEYGKQVSCDQTLLLRLLRLWEEKRVELGEQCSRKHYEEMISIIEGILAASDLDLETGAVAGFDRIKTEARRALLKRSAKRARRQVSGNG